jgi:hypothetical protein
MRRLSLLVVFVLSACGAAVDNPDLALIPPGCRTPSKCYAGDCSCNRADVQSDKCIVCDPTQLGTQQCDCVADMGQMCVEPLQLCVGRGPVCPGVGARCAAADHLDGGDPPTLVGVDSGDGGAPSSVQRCAYADDVCIPGSDDGGADLSVPDLGNADDLSGTD